MHHGQGVFGHYLTARLLKPSGILYLGKITSGFDQFIPSEERITKYDREEYAR